MKSPILFICLILNTCLLFAQAQPVVSKKTDSTASKSNKLNSSNLKLTDGSNMLPTNDVATNIARCKELSTFNKTIHITGFTESFKCIGPITVFVPNNQAFSNLSPDKLDSLLTPERKYDLIALVSYHVIAGKVTGRNITHKISSHKGLATFITLAGSKLMAKLDENRNIILIDENGGKSTISRFNIKQSNGLVHITNSVLIPKFKNI